jgi:hypothetical protein
VVLVTMLLLLPVARVVLEVSPKAATTVGRAAADAARLLAAQPNAPPHPHAPPKPPLELDHLQWLSAEEIPRSPPPSPPSPPPIPATPPSPPRPILEHAPFPPFSNVMDDIFGVPPSLANVLAGLNALPPPPPPLPPPPPAFLPSAPWVNSNSIDVRDRRR